MSHLANVWGVAPMGRCCAGRRLRLLLRQLGFWLLRLLCTDLIVWALAPQVPALCHLLHILLLPLFPVFMLRPLLLRGLLSGCGV